MWKILATNIVRYRIGLLAITIIATIYLGYIGFSRFEIVQEFVQVIPPDDQDYIDFQQFKKDFGQDANVLAIAIKSPRLFTPEVLNKLIETQNAIAPLAERVIGLANAVYPTANDSSQTFTITKLVPKPLQTPKEADAIKNKLRQQPLLRQFLCDKQQSMLFTAVYFSPEIMKSKEKHQSIRKIQDLYTNVASSFGGTAHFSGVPYIRYYVAAQLPKELALFSILAVSLTVLALLAIYRSFYAIVFPLILVIISGIGMLGFIGLLGYKMTLLSALLPPIIIILTIPPCIYMLAEYHEHYKKTGDKLNAIKTMVSKMGLVTLMINANTGIGFLTLYLTQINILQEFGLAAFVGTTFSFFVTITLLPGIFSFLPPPTQYQLRYLESQTATNFLDKVIYVIKKKRQWVYGLSLLLVTISCIGLWQLEAVSYMADDIDEKEKIIQDLRLFEKNLGGIMPFEMVLTSEKKEAFQKYSMMKKVNQFQSALDTFPELSRSLSYIDLLKWGRQALSRGDSSDYTLPVQDEIDFIGIYTENTKKQNHTDNLTFNNQLIDSTKKKIRISAYTKDIGSAALPNLITKVSQVVDTIFNSKKQEVTLTITGTTRIFMKANEYLIDNLIWSLIALFILIGLQMWVLFGSFKIMILSLIPNLIPLFVTAGAMGFLGMNLKPSTALIYELAFGIAIDNTIHFLSAYRYVRKTGIALTPAVYLSVRTTGMSILYTSIILFAGFGTFGISAFGSTKALGILTSLTLFIALFSNLFLMPALLLNFDNKFRPTEHALIDES